MTVTYIWFDLGYTLVYQNREAHYHDFLREKGVVLKLEKIEEAYHLADKLFMREYPGALGKGQECFYPWYIGVLNYSLGLHYNLTEQCIRLKELQAAEGAVWRAYPFIHSVLQWLKERSYGIGLISNWDTTAREVLEQTGLLPYFDHVIISSELSFEKPDEQIFTHAMHAAGVAPESCLYVGDNYYDDVIGSARVGMASCLVNRFGSLGIEELPAVSRIVSVEELPQLLSATNPMISYNES